MGKKKPHAQVQNQKKASQKISQEQQKSTKSDSNQQIMNELLHINQLMRNCQQQFNQQQFCYIVSSKWYKDWKQYTGYENLKKQQDPSKSKYFGKRRPNKMNKDIITDSDKYIQIPQQLTYYSFLNVKLKDDLQKNTDYIIVNKKIWDYFVQKYEGTCIQRLIRHQKKGNYFDVDLHTFYLGMLSDQQILNIRQMKEPQIKKKYEQLLSVKKIQVAGIWGLVDFKKFIKQYIRVKYQISEQAQQDLQITVWKAENFLTLKDFQLSTLLSIHDQSNQILGRIINQQDYEDLDLDQFIKGSYVLFIQFGSITFSRKQLPEIIQGHCQQCLQKEKLEFKCTSCDLVFYCSDKCKYDDKKFHRNICKTCYQSDDDNQYFENKVQQSQQITKCGLINLGNTCYMNASLQCLTNINQFVNYFKSNRYLSKINPKQISQNDGIFIKKFGKFTKKMQKYEILAPWSLKTQISYYINIFRGYNQHDANDFIVNFLNTLAQFTINDNPNNNFPPFIMDTFLGWFKSYVICPQCCFQSTTIQPFLEVSLPVKAKVPKKEFGYIFVKSWKEFQKGTFIIKDTWEQIFNDLGFDKNFKKMIGSEGSTITELIQQKPEQIYKKYKKDYIIIYPIENKTNLLEISVTLTYTKLLSGNQAKCSYGFPILIRVDQCSEIYTIYIEIMKNLGFGQQKIKLFDDFINKSKKELEKLQHIDLDNLSNQEKQKLIEQNQKQIQKLQIKITQQYQDLIKNKLQLRLQIFSTKKSKKNCTFCNKKCNNCPFPYSLKTKFTDLVKLADDNSLKLQLIYNKNHLIQMQKKVNAKYNPFTTLEECIEEFSKPQQLDQYNPWYCPRCDNMRLAFKQLKIQNYPNILVLHLKRFKDQNGKKIKNNEVVSYPETLVLSDIKYRLNSIIIHQGSLQGGHYWAISKKQQQYYSFNDDKVKEQSSYFNKNAYILFYEKL